MSSKDVELEVQVLAQTDRAIKVRTGMGEAWIPISQISDYSGSEDLDHRVETIFVPEWLATEKGLV